MARCSKTVSKNVQYQIELLNAADYGVPQKRRLILIGSRTTDRLVFDD